MTRLVRGVGADDRVAKQIQVADGVEDLVLDELVRVAQTVSVQNAVLVHHDRVVQAAPEGESLRAHHLDVGHESEGARTAHLLHVRAAGEIDHDMIAGGIERRVIEIDAEVEPVALEWVEAHELVALPHFDRLRTRTKRFGADCASIPADWIR